MERNPVNRRKFLKMSATAGVSSIFIPDAVASSSNQSLVKEEEIPVRTLGKTGIRIPILSMGVMRADNPNVVRAAFNSGLVHFDTANGYQNGKNEEMVGSFFKGKPRNTYIIATKAKFDYPLRDNFETDFQEKLDTSLKRLQNELLS